MATRSPQVINTATAAVSVRVVPGQDPEHVAKCVRRVLEKDPPWNAQVDVQTSKVDKAWMTDGSLAEWLHKTAVRLYPESAYAAREGRTA